MQERNFSVAIWRTVLMLLIGVATLGIVGGCKSKGGGPAAAAPPPGVTVAQPKVQTVTDYLTFTGNTAVIDSVKLVARVEGYLEELHFTDGTQVKKDDLLFTIQQEQYKAQLEQAEAQLEAQQAALSHAKTELVRYADLLKQDASSQIEVDHWQYEKETAEAGVRNAKAQVEIAKLNLSYTLVKAPFDGRMGRHLVDPGNVVGALGQQTPLAEIERLDPMYVYFTINERDLLRIRQNEKATPHQPITDKTIPAAIGLMNEEGFPREGRLDFASLSVAPTTGTLQLRGIVPNQDHSLLPGLFARIRVPTAERRDALLVPGDAVSFDQQGEYVLVVNDKNVVERRAVKTGDQIDNSLVIDEGLKADDWVIVEGRLQAIPGREVNSQRDDHSASAPAKAAPASN
ncbi:MAG: efflux RND transporter periplasmic adaptor subunit [Deltaproteobacteria bacterium]|nr:efflux RND transporter periplasmic adaptor subunit [Deltaproteobacteria bacterium]